MRKEKTLSLILAIAITLSQSSIFNINRAFASTGKDEADKEDLINRDEISMESGLDGPGSEKIDIGNSFTLTNSGDYDYSADKRLETKWYLTIKNTSDRAIYLGEIYNPSSDENMSFLTSKNLYFQGFTIESIGIKGLGNLKDTKFQYKINDLKNNQILKGDSHLENKSHSFGNRTPIDLNIRFVKPLQINPNEYIKLSITSNIFPNDYENPFNSDGWKRTFELKENEKNTLLNRDHYLVFKAGFYYDENREKPITPNNLLNAENFTDIAMSSFKINADIGSLDFPDGVQTFLKKADEEGFNKVDEIPSLNTDDTLKFVLPIKINSNSDKYKEFLEESNNKQYLVNPRFLINQGDDESLDQKFYIEHNKETYELSSQPTDDGEFTEIDFGNNLPDFMEEFNLVYEVKFTNSDRTHGLNKNIKLIYDNSDFIKVDKGIDSLNVDLKADYQDAHKDYLVNFETNGHGILDSQTIAENGKATEPTRPEASGYSFEGWYADESFTEKFDFNTLITKNTTLYAKWAKLMKISYRFESKNKGESLPDEITALLEKLSPVEDRVGEKIKAPQNIFEDVKVNNGIWSFKGWDKGEIILSEDGDNVFVGKWAFIENPKENPKADSTKENPSKNQKDSHNNQNNPYIKPGEGTEKEPDNKENADQVREKENDPEEEFDLNRSKEAENQSSADIENQDKKSSLDDEDKSNVDASSKENLTDFSGADEKSSQSDNKNLKETKADLKVVGTNGKSSKKEAKEVKKLDKSQFNKAHKDQKLIGEAEISVKEISKIADSLPNKGKKMMKSATNPKTGIADMGFVSSILALASVGFYRSKKSKKD